MKSTFSDQINQGSNWEKFQPVLQHFIKNKLQGINGGSYIVDYGIKNECLKTIEKGWQIVHRNQDDIIRCTTALMLVDRRCELHFERVYFDEVMREALEDFDRRSPDNSLRDDRDLTIQPILCDADIASLQSCLLNILRFLDVLKLDSGGGLKIYTLPENEILACRLGSTGESVEIDASDHVRSDSLSPDQEKLLTVEWMAIKKVMADHRGKISFSYVDGFASFTLELPISAQKVWQC